MLSVEFDRDNKAYLPGEVVRCRWKVLLGNENTFKSIYVRFYGRAEVWWREDSSSDSNSSSTTYTAKEEYFKVYIPLCGQKNGKLQLKYPLK